MTTPREPLDVQPIADRAAQATPGPWEETWRDISWAEGYQVSDFGNVRSRLRKGNHKQRMGQEWRTLALYTRDDGRVTVSLPKGSSYRTTPVAHLVLEMFVGPRPEGHEVAHNNGKPGDNRLVNLRYCTHVENEADKRQHGTAPIGCKNAMAKLQGWQVAEIKYLASKSVPQGKIATLFDISYKDVSGILCGNSWTHEAARTDIPALLAEVARLRGLIAQAEWQAAYGETYDWSPIGACPWCGGTERSDAGRPAHACNCPAFSAPGVPR